MFRTICAVFVVLMILLVVPCISGAETIDVEIKGVDDGVRTTIQQDYKEAVLFAKREAIERAGVKIKSMTTIKDYVLNADYIESQAEGVLLPGYRVVDVGYSENGTYQVVLIGEIAVVKSSVDESHRPGQQVSKPTPQKTPTKPSGMTFTNFTGMKFVLIPAGTFIMGSPVREIPFSGFEGERQHRVTISKPFYMQTCEVTQRQWRAIMGSNPSHFKNCGDDCPVEKVSWNDAQGFIRKLNQREGTNKYRLPTEAEWEYACRAGSDTAFANGDITELSCGHEPNLDAIGWYCGNSGKQAHLVGGKIANGWGLYDMHGNVWEWCQDWQGDYPSGHVTDPNGPSSGTGRIKRGGSWKFNAWVARSGYRGWNPPDLSYDDDGFRVARTY